MAQADTSSPEELSVKDYELNMKSRIFHLGPFIACFILFCTIWGKHLHSLSDLLFLNEYKRSVCLRNVAKSQ